MNILLELADRDLIIIGFALVVLILFGIIFFSFFGKNKPFDKEEEKLTDEQLKAREELERVFNQMSADLEAQNPEPEEIETFEREQEENAIISYQELIRQAKAKEKEPIVEASDKKFKNSDIISPIFGIQKEKYIEPKENVPIDRTYQEMKKNYEDENNREFLDSLKEFRKNL